jgi:hypothetical protein
MNTDMKEIKLENEKELDLNEMELIAAGLGPAGAFVKLFKKIADLFD